jgi:hypothetical protein
VHIAWGSECLRSYLHNIPPSIRLIGDIAWLAGALGISLKGTGALLGIGLKDVEGWLWQIELDGSVAVAATYLPLGAKPSRVSGGSLGELSPAREQARRNSRAGWGATSRKKQLADDPEGPAPNAASTGVRTAARRGRVSVTAAVVRDGGVVAAVQADGREKGAAAAIMMGL